MTQSMRAIVVFFLSTALWGCDSGPPAPAAGGVPSVRSVDGVIEGTLDGEPRKWHITSGELNGEQTSQSSWDSYGGVNQITLFGHTSPDTLISGEEALVITITTSSLDATAEVFDAEVAYLSGGMMQGYGSNEEGGFVRLVTDSLRSEGESLQLSGHFEARMSFRALGSSDDAPDRQTRSITGGRFEASVRKGD